MAVWASEFEPFGFEVAHEAVRWYCTTRDYPVLADVLEAIHEAEYRHRELEQPRRYELPPAQDAVGPTAEFLATVERLAAGMNEDRDHAAEDADWHRYVDAVKAGARMAGACGGSGKRVVERDGKRVCPDCGVEVPDIEVRIPRKRAG
jgi:hypothetical protein